MKKLLTLIGAAAVSFGLYADPAAIVPSRITFEEGQPGVPETVPGAFDVTALDANDRLLWYTEADLSDIAATVTAWDDAPSGAGENYLALETGTEPLFRAAAEVLTEANVTNAQQVSVTGGVYFNQLVKFSAFDSDPTDLSEDAKVAVWLKAVDAEDGVAETNLYISTAILNEFLTPTVTNVVVSGVNVEPDSWHQLKITAIPAYKNLTGGKIAMGFVVAVDGVELSTTATLFPSDADLEVGDVTVGASKLIAEKKLFPSRIIYSNTARNGQTLLGVGYQGSGALDNIVVNSGNEFEISTNLTVLLPAHVEISGNVISTNGYVVGKSGDIYTIAKGDTIQVTLAPAAGYRFKDGKARALYYFDIDGVTAIAFDDTEAEEDISTYPVVFFNNTLEEGGVAYLTNNVSGGSTAVAPAAPAAPTGQSFEGWFETNGVEYVAFDFGTAITNALDLFAQFTNNYYTVTYLTNGVEFAKQVVEYGHATTEPDPAPVAPAGQSFDCWLENGVEFSFDTLITNNITLTASFTADAYTLTLTAGANTTLTASPDQASYAYGATVTLTATAESGFEFSSMPEDWTLVSATVLTKEITITENTTINGPAATAVAPSTYTVTFDFADGVTAASNATVAAGATVAQPADPTRSGYTFNGWKLYGEAYNFSTAVTSNFTLTAAWTAAGGWDPNPETIPENTPAATKYPALVGTALATADAKKLTIWANANSVTFSAAEAATAESTIVEAYILNCAPTAEAVATEKAAFKASISMSGSTATVTLPIGKTYNVAPVMKGSNNLTSWTATEVTTGYQFFKFVLELPVANP